MRQYPAQPPGVEWASSVFVSMPAAWRRAAMAVPDTPAPITMTSLLLSPVHGSHRHLEHTPKALAQHTHPDPPVNWMG